MALLRTSLALLALLAVTACNAPTTIDPDVTQQELRAEAEAQRIAAKQAPLDFNDNKTYGEHQVEALAGRLAPIATRVSRAAGALCNDMYAGKRNCTFTVVLAAKERGVNAHADGQNVAIYPGMVDFTRNDNQLAFAIAHEFAHNIMQHVQASTQNIAIGSLLGSVADIAVSAAGANSGGVFGQIGQYQGRMQYSVDYEAEADYVGLYILARSGYRIEDAPDFWRIMSRLHPDSINMTSDHPNNPSRTIAMGKTVEEIRAKQKVGTPLIPNIRPKK
ncbi:MAG: M48 family metallopeptidase [Rickettsiales bacterium]